MFGRKAQELIEEFARSDPNQLVAYNGELIHQVIEECHGHQQQAVALLNKVQQQGLDWAAAPQEDSAAIFVHFQSILRNKRCLLAYIHHRSDRIRRLRWQLGAILPGEIQDNLSTSEKEYFRNYSDALGSYMADVGMDLTVDVLPPKDPYIEVRVLKDAGTLFLDNKIAHLEPNTVHLVKRAEAEPLILQGVLEHREF